MIPSIEDIVDGLLAGEYKRAQAVAWLQQHAEGDGDVVETQLTRIADILDEILQRRLA